MTKGERIFLGLGLVALVALLLHRFGAPVIVASDEKPPVVGDVTEADLTNGLSYYMSAAPYAFSPPVQNVMPSRTIGQEGQVVQPGNAAPGADLSLGQPDCGCGG